ncbi:efflux RND transporter periplasmic adaptor subunit [Ancylobacter dichloromethanicus]|uniref:Secretion protein HlyD n=1 Tax=Ancylobacter dichloromethanicus TaxID=518825 RepID=A0A9W6JA59_9HYPH|nr:efflux RND transporter periplasmic adaptor subunit [Ancylobacter dichloromethanicus]MBS7552528.1 efflux RND transporter periplasmic adaptor subunit [Ancylobacter dichloromethanicus]GLK71888.1 secretion protein HlyD [Ancylobacter dichloromethanicus]
MLQKSESSWTGEKTTRRRRRRRWPWLLAAVLLAGGGYFYYAEGTAPQQAPALQTATVELGDIETNVTAIAKMQPKTYVDVGTQVSGQLRTIHPEVGDLVKKDDLLAEIDPTVYQTRVAGDRASLDNLRAQLAQAEAQLALDKLRNGRAQQLLKNQAGSRDAADAAMATERISEAKIDALKAQIAQTQATLDGDLANLGYTKIYAPMDGTVVSITAREGGTLNANQSAPIVLRIADLQTMTVTAQVAEGDIPRVTVGTPASFSTLGLPDRRWRGTVRQIEPTPTIVNDVVLYNVLIDVPNDDLMLMTDMTAQVFFRLGEAKGVPLVPTPAVRTARDGTQSVRVLTPQGPQERTVKTGLSNRSQTQILEGLEPGETVILGTGAAAAPRPGGGRPRMPPRLG